MHIWRNANPICPVCGTLVGEHSADDAFECEEIIHSRLQDTLGAVSLLQDAKTALSGQYCLAKKNERRKHGKRKQTS